MPNWRQTDSNPDYNQYCTDIVHVGVRYNPSARKLAFTVKNRMTYLDGIETLAEATARVNAMSSELKGVRTMAQLLKVLHPPKTMANHASPGEPTNQEVADEMIRTGGGFVQALGYAFKKADGDNEDRIIVAFANYWIEYKERARLCKLPPSKPH